MSGPLETKTSYKTTGGADLPNTKQPGAGAEYDNTVAPYNHDGNDVSGYIGVSEEYRTYSDVRNKPLGTTAEHPVFLANPNLEETESVRSPETVASESESDAPSLKKPRARKASAK